ncbi:unnamed protein product [Kluyveromyces dobzhanskii CBS 2104]|uniref:WGS project CCBQ000000000 data, contig 00012 n=1 Tax=Kluyveromyces dobzhanskii CBS 2104 TaxID=1427455 RepID=A0A0A8L0Q0_9SACH|nr:unnamed protein product [Kluyveromyces dobzhanskii CBS 2104]
MCEELGSVLKTIKESLKACGESLDKLEEVCDDEQSRPFEGSAVVGHDGDKLEKVSLLSLKNGSMLSYLNSLLLVLGQKLNKQMVIEDGRVKAVEQRVVLERGVKPLEKKLGYQLDKLTRAYTRLEKEVEESKKRAELQGLQPGLGKLRASSTSRPGTGSGSDSDSDSDSEEETQYRPNGSGMVDRTAPGKKATGKSVKQGEEDADNRDNVYRPPKISAVLPPKQQHFEDKFNAQEHKDKSTRSRMQAMEEYLKDSAEQPEWEASIGANIVNHGRGGVKTSRDTERERGVQKFEEDNFTRLNPNGSKTDKRMKKQREIMAKVNMIAGEDFSIFNSKRKLEDSTSRRGNKKSRNAWERAKKKL